jgi:hypothetical protein
MGRYVFVCYFCKCLFMYVYICEKLHGDWDTVRRNMLWAGMYLYVIFVNVCLCMYIYVKNFMVIGIL